MTVQEAVELGELLRHDGLFQHVKHGHAFVNDHFFYRFADIEVSSGDGTGSELKGHASWHLSN